MIRDGRTQPEASATGLQKVSQCICGLRRACCALLCPAISPVVGVTLSIQLTLLNVFKAGGRGALVPESILDAVCGRCLRLLFGKECVLMI